MASINGNNVWEFGSAQECARQAMKMPTSRFPVSQRHALQLLTGDDKLAERARALCEQFTRSIELPQAQLVPDVCGAFPMVPEFLGGDPECMMQMHDVSSPNATLNIVVDPTGSSGAQDKMENRGIAIIALCMALSAVRPVQLYVFACWDARPEFQRPWGIGSFVKLRIESSPLDLATACVALCSSGVGNGVFGAMLDIKFGGPHVTGWPLFHAPDCRGQRTNPMHPAMVREQLAVGGFNPDLDLFIGAASYSDQSLMNDPQKWVREQFDKYAPEIA